MTKYAILLLAALLSATLSARADNGTPTPVPRFSHDPTLAEELRERDGLPNLVAKLAAGGPVRIAYLGGSITAANGWRPKTFAWLKSRFPKAELVEINAAISGTGSDYGACRIASDVLAQHPDVVFMEHRVNGGDRFEAQSVEGIVRQIWKADPHTDVCLVYTLSSYMLKDLQAGKQTSFGTVMERVANVYGIPSIDLGVEIARREKAGDLVFKSDVPVDGKLVFSKDGTHPSDAGYDVYREVIARSLLAMTNAAGARVHVLPSPLSANAWETATLLPVARVALSAGWQKVEAKTDPIYREDLGRTDAMLRGAVKCTQTGETVTVRWDGTTLGFSDIPQGDGIEVEVTLDGAQPPIAIKRPQTDHSVHYARFFYLPEQPHGVHTAVLRVTRLPEGTAFYCGQVLVVGTPLP